jgi:hypothetical protein
MAEHEDLDLCSACKIGSLRPTGETVIPGQSTQEYGEIGTRRVFLCDNCRQRLVRVANHLYSEIDSNVRTKPRDLG